MNCATNISKQTSVTILHCEYGIAGVVTSDYYALKG